jgi:Protein of unknown function (DUF1214)
VNSILKTAINAIIVGIMCSIFTVRAQEAGSEGSWESYVAGLPALQEKFVPMLRDPNDPLLRQELYKFMYSNLSWGYFTRMYQDASYPDFWPMFNQVYPIGFANPDDSYYQAVIDDQGAYRVSGNRGTTYIFDFQIGSGPLSSWGTGQLGPTKRNFEIDRDVTIQPDGTFDFILSPKRPEGYEGDWLPLDPGATFIWVRQISYDWENERDGLITIERLDVPARKPRESAERMVDRMQLLSDFVDNWTTHMLQWEEFVGQPLPTNDVVVLDFSKGGGIKTQRYIQGKFEIRDGEALILETELPEECRYWMFHLVDEFMSSFNWLHNQTTINGHYAKVDSDGKFRAVISNTDPGVANWLDPSGYEHGYVVGRWKECSSFPKPTVRKVKVSEVLKHLPADTATVTPAEREVSLRKMRRAAQMRRRW